METTRPSNDVDPDHRNGGSAERGSTDARTAEKRPAESRAGNAERREAGAAPRRPPGRWNQETESFGAWLARHRLVRGIELREISEDSKIGLTYLQAFEDDRFDLLPAPVFAKGFLRQYANYVGLDPEEVVNFYLSALDDQELGDEPDEPAAEPRRADPVKLVGLVVAALAILILIWFLTRGDGEPDAPPGAAADSSAGGESRPVTGAAAPPALAASVPAFDASAVPAEEPATGPPLKLTLDFSGECWVEISVDGERQVAENKIQGESLVLEAREAIDVRLGDVAMVEAELNGRPFQFDDVPGTRVRNQRIDLDTAAAAGGR